MDLNVLIHVVLVLVVLGLVLYLIRSFIPLDPVINNLISVVIAVGVILWLLQYVGIWGGRL